MTWNDLYVSYINKHFNPGTEAANTLPNYPQCLKIQVSYSRNSRQVGIVSEHQTWCNCRPDDQSSPKILHQRENNVSKMQIICGALHELLLLPQIRRALSCRRCSWKLLVPEFGGARPKAPPLFSADKRLRVLLRFEDVSIHCVNCKVFYSVNCFCAHVLSCVRTSHQTTRRKSVSEDGRTQGWR